ncbi:B3 domain-containing protein Os05g0481400-like [Papaver somniferum]|uniref:B3 domain-containing protein Os05g0481400-like n=1 Tax=Papaver somniferum TaxID=3469 RepID=UPI000E6F6413|nr:B3 domain-containing protein Os05g0481400-like [Papaver somniferum]
MAKGPSNNPYEEARKQRLEENMRRFQELGVAKFVNSLKEEVINIKKKSLPKHQVKVKKTTINPPGPLRCSTRPRAEASYVEDLRLHLYRILVFGGMFVPDSPSPSPRRKRLRSSSSTSYIARRIATKMQRSYPLKRAKRFESRLSSGHPSCVKSLRSSHVSGNFVLKMPQEFCNDHIPKEKLTMVLEDEEGSIYDTRYLGEFAVDMEELSN